MNEKEIDIFNPREYSQLPHDSKNENDVVYWLKSLEEIKKFEFIWKVLRLNSGAGLKLVKRSQLNPVHLEVILEFGFVYGDASFVEYWYAATKNGLGHKKIFKMLEAHLSDAPLIVHKMLYWIEPENENEEKNLRILNHDFNKKHPNFKSSRSTGIHATK